LSISAISRRYAKALVELGAERKMVEKYGEELAKAGAAFAAQGPLRIMIQSPTFPPEKKEALLADLIQALALSPGVRNFLGLLLAKDRLQYLPQIEADYRRLADELSGILRARVVAAAELETSHRQALVAELERQTGKKIEIKTQVDPGLIGGLQVEIGGRVFDGSLKTQLKRIEETLKKG
jgi:F-type H+-transporting ATPase subunit delta